MRRSQLNEILAESQALFAQHQIALPPFAHFTPNQWAKHDLRRFQEVFDLQLGWDVTDMGSNDFASMGLTLFTLRNGSIGGQPYPKPYAEKIMISREGQITPCHFHWYKMEDIIHRGGGNMIIELYNRTADEQCDTTDIEVVLDGERQRHKAGTRLRLTAGQSITLTQGLYHSFWAEPGFGPVILGEVSMVNDDRCDNRFLQPQSRFSEIEEDEPPLHILCNEYARFLPLQEPSLCR
jgi:D-lyxose ketol-isomerase